MQEGERTAHGGRIVMLPVLLDALLGAHSAHRLVPRWSTFPPPLLSVPTPKRNNKTKHNHLQFTNHLPSAFRDGTPLAPRNVRQKPAPKVLLDGSGSSINRVHPEAQQKMYIRIHHRLTNYVPSAFRNNPPFPVTPIKKTPSFQGAAQRYGLLYY